VILEKMIKTNKPKGIAWRLFPAVVAAIIAVVSQQGYGQLYEFSDPATDYNRGYSLLIEQSPIDAGRVTPQTGVYKADLDEVVTLTAVAKPGYQFVYWLGDVTDPTTNETTTLMDSPKMVIAVFERSKFDLPIVDSIISGPGRGGLRGIPDFRPRRGGRDSSSGGQPPREPPEPPEPLENEFPVPAEPFPVPENDNEEIPEPATVTLLGLGALLPILGRGKRKPTI
jgi:hypothetical protein